MSHFFSIDFLDAKRCEKREREKKVLSRISYAQHSGKITRLPGNFAHPFCVCKLLSSEVNEKICFGVGRSLRELLKNRIGQGVPQSDPPNFLLVAERDREKEKKEVENGTVRIEWGGGRRGYKKVYRSSAESAGDCRKIWKIIAARRAAAAAAREIVRVADEKGDSCEKKYGCNFRVQRDRCGCRTGTSGDRSSRVARKVSIR